MPGTTQTFSWDRASNTQEVLWIEVAEPTVPQQPHTARQDKDRSICFPNFYQIPINVTARWTVSPPMSWPLGYPTLHLTWLGSKPSSGWCSSIEESHTFNFSHIKDELLYTCVFFILYSSKRPLTGLTKKGLHWNFDGSNKFFTLHTHTQTHTCIKQSL